MPSFNRILLLGHTTRDPELRYTTQGTPVATFGLATNESRGKGDDRKEFTEFHSIVVWGKLAEAVNQYSKKGQQVFVEGKLSTRSWEDRDGNKRQKTEIVASTVTFLSRSDSQS